MTQKRIELVFDDDTIALGETVRLASFEVQDSGMLHISFPDAGTIKLGPSGWNDLVAAVEAAFEDVSLPTA